MGIREKFSEMSIARQVQLLFILSAFLLCGVLVVITKFQLDWIRSVTVSEASRSFKNRLYNQIESIGQVQAAYFDSEFTAYEEFTLNLAKIDELINGFSSSYKSRVFKTSTAYSEESFVGLVDYSHGVYYSKNSALSSAGQDLVKNESVMNFIYPTLYTNYFSGYYQGYTTDELINYYPSIKSVPGYTPLPREWFYRGFENQRNVTITEPYQDDTKGSWIVSLSRAVMKDKKPFGVAACDVTLDSLTEKMNKVKVLDNGFGVLVSATGIVLTIPDHWKTANENYLRIFDSFVTGISFETWQEIRDKDDASWSSISIEEDEDYGISSAELRVFKKNIRPKFQTNVTHYFLLIVDKADTEDVEDTINEKFDDTYVILFWVILAFGIAVLALVLILTCCFGNDLTKHFAVAEEILGGLLRRGFFTQKNKPFDLVFPSRGLMAIETFKRAVNEKVIQLEQKENKYEHQSWFKTRPEDCLYYIEWSRHLYPRYSNPFRESFWESKLDRIMSKFK